MNVFISWSGGASHGMAKALAEWLPTVIQAMRPFLSSEDIQKGTRWFSEIGDRLDKTDYGILCLTKSNLSSPWIHFEAGALSKRVEVARVVPFLVDVRPTDLTPPLSNFNAVTAPNVDEVRKLIRNMNAALGDTRLADSVVEKSFGRAWPDFEKAVKEVQALAAKETTGANASKTRSAEDMLEEVLSLARDISQGQQLTLQLVEKRFRTDISLSEMAERYALGSQSSARGLSEINAKVGLVPLPDVQAGALAAALREWEKKK
jgi:TIR domain-containing protein